jgi:hypothetical protein
MYSSKFIEPNLQQKLFNFNLFVDASQRIVETFNTASKQEYLRETADLRLKLPHTGPDDIS